MGKERKDIYIRECGSKTSTEERRERRKISVRNATTVVQPLLVADHLLRSPLLLVLLVAWLGRRVPAMLTSSPSPSPTIHANATSSVTATTTAPFRCAYDNGSYRQRHSLPAFYQQSRSRRASNPPVGKWSSVSAPAGTAAAATTTTSTITNITADEAATADASAVAPRRIPPAVAKRAGLARPAPVARETVDAGTQYSPPLAAQQRTEKLTSKAVGLATGGNNDFTLIDLGRTGKRRAGSPSSQKSSSSGGEPRAPALGPQMPEHRAVPEKAPAVVSPTTAQEPAVDTAPSSSTPEKTTEKPPSSARDSADALALFKRLRTAMPAIRIMAARYEQCDTKHLVRLIADMLMELVRFNDDIPLKDGRLTRFHSRWVLFYHPQPLCATYHEGSSIDRVI